MFRVQMVTRGIPAYQNDFDSHAKAIETALAFGRHRGTTINVFELSTGALILQLQGV